MKKLMLITAAGVAALWMAGCERNDSGEPPNGAETEAAAETLAGGSETAAEDAEDTEHVDMFAAPECVIDPPPDAVCTMDVNACGQASVCGCPDGYSYDAALGKCLLNLEGVSEATFVSVDDSECVRPATDACTRDINACGQPSSCSCDEGFVWNDVVGKCLRDLSQPE